MTRWQLVDNQPKLAVYDGQLFIGYLLLNGRMTFPEREASTSANLATLERILMDYAVTLDHLNRL